jgi:hypothetical protein
MKIWAMLDDVSALVALFDDEETAREEAKLYRGMYMIEEWPVYATKNARCGDAGRCLRITGNPGTHEDLNGWWETPTPLRPAWSTPAPGARPVRP